MRSTHVRSVLMYSCRGIHVYTHSTGWDVEDVMFLLLSGFGLIVYAQYPLFGVRSISVQGLSISHKLNSFRKVYIITRLNQQVPRASRAPVPGSLATGIQFRNFLITIVYLHCNTTLIHYISLTRFICVQTRVHRFVTTLLYNTIHSYGVTHIIHNINYSSYVFIETLLIR